MRIVPSLLGGGAGYDAPSDCGGGLQFEGGRVAVVIGGVVK